MTTETINAHEIDAQVGKRLKPGDTLAILFDGATVRAEVTEVEERSYD